MKPTDRFKRGFGLPAGILSAVALIACGGAVRDENGLSGMIVLDGSSTVYPISEAVAEEFRTEAPGVNVTVGISGTGGGFKKFLRRETDMSNASRPISESELQLSRENGLEFIELPVAYDGLAVVVNPANNWVDYLTVAELKRMWEPEAQQKITRWNQIRASFPDRPLVLFGAGVDSGTFDYFTQAIVGTEKSSRGDFTPSEDDNILVQGVAGDENALGFFGFAYFEENQDRLKLVPIDDENPGNGEGPIFPSIETVSGETYQPLSRPIFIYVSRDALQRPEVVRFVEFYVENAGQLSEEVGYIPLPERGYEMVMQRFQQRTTGSVFEGGRATVGVSIEDLLKMESDAP